MSDLQMAQIEGTPALDGRYISGMDMWPLECQEFNRLHQFYDNLREGRFTTTKCPKCGYIAFPPGVICPRCWSDRLAVRGVSGEGSVFSFAIYRRSYHPALPEPYTVALIQLREGPRLISNLLGRTADDVGEFTLPRFEPARTEAKQA